MGNDKTDTNKRKKQYHDNDDIEEGTDSEGRVLRTAKRSRKIENENPSPISSSSSSTSSPSSSSSSAVSLGWKDMPRDLLHYIFSFFFADDSTNVVDETSILSMMLISKHWNEVATSHSLWTTIRSNNPRKRRRKMPPTELRLLRNVFHINSSIDLFCNPPAEVVDEKKKKNNFFRPSSFLGFSKLESVQCTYTMKGQNDDREEKTEDKEMMTVFRVQERSTHQRFLFCVSSRQSRSKTILSHIYESKRMIDPPGEEGVVAEEERVLTDPTTIRPLFVFGSNCQRIVMVYPDLQHLGDEEEEDSSPLDFPSFANRLIQLCFSKKDQSSCPTQPLWGSIPWDSRSGIGRRADSSSSSSTNLIKTRHWAAIVDWIFEVVTCFNLQPHLVFSAMELFRRFVHYLWNILGKLPPTAAYQVLASASLLIAAKCQCEDGIQPEDFPRCADNTFTVEQLLVYESAILSALEWDLYTPTLVDCVFSLRRKESLEVRHEETLALGYLSSLAFQSQILKHMDIRRAADAIVMMTRYWLQMEGQPLWREEEEELDEEFVGSASSSFEDVCSDVVVLSHSLEDIRQRYPHLKVITRFYCRRSCLAGKAPIPLIPSTVPLEAYRARTV